MSINYKPSNIPIYHEMNLNDKKILLVLKGISEEIKNRILRFDFDQLTLDHGDWSDLSFLKDHNQKIKSLKIGSQNCDWEVINNFHNLEELTIGGWFKTNISFKKFTQLKFLSTYWNDGYTDEIYQLPKLEKLIITGGNDLSCENFSNYKNLRYLEIVDSYKLETCNGLEKLKNLEEVRLIGIRKLVDINSLGLLNSLRLVSLEACGKLSNLDGLDRSSSLKEVYIERCKNIQEAERKALISTYEN